ncbi:transcription elongation factor GreA [Candidatus Saccharibacteria bacterium]|nr:transcription elongation factor GreA [Candidatus Saccharibacteria bacterium]
MKKTHQVTAAGLKDLEKELEVLKSSRGEIAEEIATARAFGDLSENSEYSAACDRRSATEIRIIEIENILKNAKVIPGGSKNRVVLGSSVTLSDGKKEQTYHLVGPVEANPLEYKISDESPLGRALLGKKSGETAEISTSKGVTTYQVISIQ